MVVKTVDACCRPAHCTWRNDYKTRYIPTVCHKKKKRPSRMDNRCCRLCRWEFHHSRLCLAHDDWRAFAFTPVSHETPELMQWAAFNTKRATYQFAEIVKAWLGLSWREVGDLVHVVFFGGGGGESIQAAISCQISWLIFIIKSSPALASVLGVCNAMLDENAATALLR